jgi:NAD(P)-dependent dehydrogenase (short-subunit alcohol dehydrogenase family)
MDLKLRKKVALVTGGAAGIGAAVVRLLAGEGVRVAFADRNQAATAAAQLISELNRPRHESLFIKAELTREADCKRCVRQTLQTFGTIDILVNNAGMNDAVGLDQTPKQFLNSLQKNLLHIFAVTHHASEALIKSRGAVVNISSKVAFTGQGHTSGYAAAKGGVNALTREWAAAFAPHGVRVNCVIPAECDTPQYQRWFASQDDPEAAIGCAPGAQHELRPVGPGDRDLAGRRARVKRRLTDRLDVGVEEGLDQGPPQERARWLVEQRMGCGVGAHDPRPVADREDALSK